jgi:ubiquinone/menaquinone biosynthesis C-methylase UbiE
MTSSDQLSAVDANRLFYAQEAEFYDKTEPCVTAAWQQKWLRSTLELALERVGRDARVLDAGGGSGNAALTLLELGTEPLLVDVSPQMIAIWERRARQQGWTPRSELASLEEFFSHDSREWDLIVFSSVVHHLEDPLRVLRAAASRLACSGLIVTIFDPVRAGYLGRILRRLDYLQWVLKTRPRHVTTIIKRRLGRLRQNYQETNLGALAEVHAFTGLDDLHLVRELEQHGMRCVAHERCYDARSAWLRVVLRRLRIPTGFAMVLEAAEVD